MILRVVFDDWLERWVGEGGVDASQLSLGETLQVVLDCVAREIVPLAFELADLHECGITLRRLRPLINDASVEVGIRALHVTAEHASRLRKPHRHALAVRRACIAAGRIAKTESSDREPMFINEFSISGALEMSLRGCVAAGVPLTRIRALLINAINRNSINPG